MKVVRQSVLFCGTVCKTTFGNFAQFEPPSPRFELMCKLLRLKCPLLPFQEHVLSNCDVTCLEHVSPLLFAGTTSGAIIMWNLETEKIVLRLMI